MSYLIITLEFKFKSPLSLFNPDIPIVQRTYGKQVNSRRLLGMSITTVKMITQLDVKGRQLWIKIAMVYQRTSPWKNSKSIADFTDKINCEYNNHVNTAPVALQQHCISTVVVIFTITIISMLCNLAYVPTTLA